MGDQFTRDLQENYKFISDLTGGAADIKFRHFSYPDGDACLIFTEGLADSVEIDRLIKTIKYHWDEGGFKSDILTNASVSSTSDIKKAVEAVLSGDCLLLIGQSKEGLIVSVRSPKGRSVSEPQTEQVVRGPRDGFVENIRVNSSLIRRRIKDPHLRVDSVVIGEKSRTDVNILYLEGTVKPGLVEEVKDRLGKIKIDAILDSGYIEELIGDAPYSPFTTVMNTERPDKASSAILEGRAVILVDNSPFALIVPATFWQFLQASDDYYSKFFAGSFFRIIRYIAFIISLILPSVYVMLASFHQEMIPTPLALTIASGREVTPFPVLFEALLMEIVFELMREAGLRMPKPIGQAVSIVGSLVIGQAAVQAGMVSPFMVIVVAVTGIASFSIPNASASFSIRLVRFPLLIASGVLGLLGFAAVFAVLSIHAVSIRSFGESYLAPATPFIPTDQKDLVIRKPLWKMDKNAATTAGNERADLEKPAADNEDDPNDKTLKPVRQGQAEGKTPVMNEGKEQHEADSGAGSQNGTGKNPKNNTDSEKSKKPARRKIKTKKLGSRDKNEE